MRGNEEIGLHTGNVVVKDDLKKCGLDSGLAKDRERWKAHLWGGKRPTCASTDKGRKTRRERKRETANHLAKFGHAATWL